MKLRLEIRAILSALLCAALVGCGEPSGDGASAPQAGRTFDGEYPIEIVCTTGMVADVVRNVGGEQVDVTQLMDATTDPHLFTAQPGDNAKLDQADMIFYSGLHLEGKMSDLFVVMARKKPTFAVTEQLDHEQLIEIADGFHDPHLWFDVSLWSRTADVVAEALADFDPDHQEEYAQRAKAYQDELAALHQECIDRLATIPRERRVLVTAHDAFSYFGRAYDLDVKAIQGVSTESEAGLQEINALVDFIVAKKIKAVFVETSVSPRNIAALVESCAASGHTVKIGGQLFSDAMGKTGTPEGTYIGMVRHNVETIVESLQ